ncbi:hypothetical protein DXG01_014111 [Tephrocybe rancida]|nr:hypothetical protein DXG01_014111 [Tephrocybe rancida]
MPIPSKALGTFYVLGHDCMEQLMFRMNLRELAALASASNGLHTLVQAHVKRTIHRILRLMGLDPVPLLKLLRRTLSAIVGSSTLLALNPWTFVPGDIDICVQRSRKKVVQLIRGLESELHMKYVGSKVWDVNKAYPNSIGGVYGIAKLTYGGRHVHILISNSGPLKPIFSFHSTCVMNFISSSYVFCAYPDLTFNFRNLINHDSVMGQGRMEKRVKACIDKYCERGYEVRGNTSAREEFDDHVCGSDPNCPRTPRALNDAGCFYFSYSGSCRRPRGIGRAWLLDSST